MSFFSWFDEQTFTFDGKSYTLEDLTSVVVNDPAYFFNSAWLEDQYIQPGVRPDQLASRLYSNVNMWWTFFIANNITANEWPLDDEELREFINRKYNHFEQTKIVKYEDDNGKEVPELSHYVFTVDGVPQYHHYNRGEGYDKVYGFPYLMKSSGTPITLLQSLENENENRRFIKVVKNRYINDFVNDFRNRIVGQIG